MNRDHNIAGVECDRTGAPLAPFVGVIRAYPGRTRGQSLALVLVELIAIGLAVWVVCLWIGLG